MARRCWSHGRPRRRSTVSGSPPVVLASSPDGALVRLIRGLAELGAAGHEPFVLIGGLAVMARLGERHRATIDIDTVSIGSPRRVVIADATSAVRTSDRDEVTVDRIEIGDIDPAALPDDPRLRLFVLAHRWAFDTAGPVQLLVRGPGGVDAGALVATATIPALLAMKLCAFASRRGPGQLPKQASDLLDLYRLLLVADVPTLQSAFAMSPYDLRPLVESHVTHLTVGGAGGTVRALRSTPALDGVRLEDIAAASETLLAALR